MCDVIDWLESQSPENLESEIPYIPEALVGNVDDINFNFFMKEIIKMIENGVDANVILLFLNSINNIFTKSEVNYKKLNSENNTYKLDLHNKKILMQIMNVFNNKDVKRDIINIPRFRRKIKSIFSNKEKEQRFSVDVGDLQNLRINLAKIQKTKFRTGNRNSPNSKRGRVINYSTEKHNRIAIVPTILNALQNGNYSLEQHKLRVLKRNYLYPKYENNIVYNLMLVLDISKSIRWIIPNIEKLIYYISSGALHFGDKLGLITFNNDLAQIYHYPTLNIFSIIGTINKLEPKGLSPLDHGLNLALQSFSREHYNLPGMKNLIIIISDFFPEPLEGGHKNLLDEPSYKNVIMAVEKIEKEKIGLILINPAADEKETWSKTLIRKIINISEAKYFEIRPIIKYNMINEEKISIDESNLFELLNFMTEIKMRI